MPENPITKFAQTSKGITPTTDIGVVNPIKNFIGQRDSKFGTQSSTMKNVLGKDADALPMTVDDARELQEKDPTLWQTISKQLMKPVGLVATSTEELGKALGTASVGDVGEAGKILLNTPKKLGGIITGTRERNFSDIWKEYGAEAGIDPKITTAIGLVTDIAADPLNFVGGGLTKLGKVTSKIEALHKIGKSVEIGSKLHKEMQALGLSDDLLKLGATKSEQAIKGQRALLTLFANTRWEKSLVGGSKIYDYTGALKTGLKQTKLSQLVGKVFSTKTSDEAFNTVKNHFDNLLDYRKGQAMDEAVDIQKSIGKLDKEESLKLLDVVENYSKGIRSGIQKVDDLAKRLTDNFLEIRNKEEGLGLLKTDIQDYFPHIKIKEKLPIAERLKGLFGDSKKYNTALGAYKKRKIAGGVNEINQMFGTEFFETRPAIAFAQRALGSAKATTSKEFFNTVKQFGKNIVDDTPDIANYVETGIKELEGLKFAPDVAQQLTAYNKAIKPEELKIAIRTFDTIQNYWKAQALVAPSYHVRNMAGNTWNNFLAGVIDPRVYFEAGKLQTGKALKFTDDAGRIWDNNLLMKAAKQTGVINEGWYAKDIESALTSELGGLSWNPLKQNFGLFRANRAVGSTFENNARLAHFIQRIKEGHTIDDAAMSVKKFLFDYGDLTEIEKGIFKRFVPFYTWTRKNIPLQFEALFKQPAKFASIVKGQKTIESQVEKPNEKYLGDYIKDNIGVRVGSDNKGNTHYFLLGNWLPAAQAIDFLSQPTENFIASVSPFIKTPAELWANKSTFFEDTFGQPSKIERYPEENQSWLGFTMRKKTTYILKNIRILNELDKLNPGGIFGDEENPSLANRIMPEMGITIPKIGTITTSEKRTGRFTPETGTGARVLQSLFGKSVPYNPSYAKKFYLWDTDTKIRELQKTIKDARRDGQKEYAKRLQEELNKVRKERSK